MPRKRKGKICFNDPNVRCEIYVKTDCVNYVGQNLPNINVSTNDTLTTILISLNDLLDDLGDGGGDIITITEGTGIDVTGTHPDFTIINSAPDQIVTLTEGSNVTITGTYPNFTIAASGGGLGTDELVKVSLNDTTGGYLNGKLIQGSGILLTENNDGGDETFTVSHADTSSVTNLDTSTAQVIDTLTFDTFGHVQTVTTRNLTLSDLGYTTPNAYRFGFSGEDDTANENRVFDLDTKTLSIRSNGGANYFDFGGSITNPYFETFYAGPTSYSSITASPGNISMYAQSNSNYYFSLIANNSFNSADLGSSRVVDGTWIDTKYETINTGDMATSHMHMHLEVWQGGPGTSSRIWQSNDGINLQTTNIAPKQNGNYKGLTILPTSDLRFENYPNTRTDSTTNKALFITSTNGDVGLGTISVDTTAITSSINIVSNSLSVETVSRISADDNLSSRINTLSNALSTLVLNSVADVSTNGVTDGQVLMFNSAANQWIASTIAAVATSVTSNEVSVAVAAETSNRISADTTLGTRIDTVSNNLSQNSVILSNLTSAVVANSAQMSVIASALSQQISALSVVVSNEISARNALSVVVSNEISARQALSVIVSNVQSAITTNSADVTSLKNRVSANSALTSNLQSAIVANSAQMSVIASALSQQISALSVIVSNEISARNALSIIVSNAQSAITTNSADVTSLKNRVGGISADVTSFKASLNNFTDVSVDGVTDGKILMYNSAAGQWVASAVAAGTGSVTSQKMSVAIAVETSNRISGENALSVRIDTVSNNLSANSVILSNLASAVVANSAQMSVIASALSQQISALSVVVSNQGSAIVANSADVTSLKNVVSNLSVQLSLQISAASTAISNIRSAVQANSADFTSFKVSLNNFGDVSIASPADQQVLVYNSAAGQWVNSTVGGSGSVTSQEVSVAIAVEVSNRISADNALSNLISVLSATLSTVASALSQQISALSVVVSNANSAIVANSADVTSLKNRVSANSAVVSVLQSTVATNSADVTSLKNVVSNLSVQLSLVASALSQQISALSVVVSNEISARQALSVIVSNAQSAITTNSADVTSLKNVVSNLSVQLSLQVSAISTRLSDITSNVGTISLNLSALSTRADIISNNLSQNSVVLSNAISAIVANSADVTSLKNRVSAISSLLSTQVSAISTELSLLKYPPVESVTSADYTLSAGDNGKIKYFTNSTSAIFVNIPTGLPVGFEAVVFRASGSTSLTISAQTSVSFEAQGTVLADPKTAAQIIHKISDQYIGIGAFLAISITAGTGSVTSAELSTAVAAETSNRISADDDLSNKISALSAILSTATSALSVRIDTVSGAVTSINNVLSALSGQLSLVASALSQTQSVQNVSIAALNSAVSILNAGLGGVQMKVVTGEQSVIATGLTKISGLSVSVGANGIYQLEGLIIYGQSGTSSHGFGLSIETGTVSVAGIKWEGNMSIGIMPGSLQVSTGTAGWRTGYLNQAGFGSVTYSVAGGVSVNANVTLELRGVAVIGTGGTIQIKGKNANNAPGVLTVRAGSYIRAHKIG